MSFFSDIFNRAGRVARGQANQGMSAIEDANEDLRGVLPKTYDRLDGGEVGRALLRADGAEVGADGFGVAGGLLDGLHEVEDAVQRAGGDGDDACGWRGCGEGGQHLRAGTAATLRLGGGVRAGPG